jgi:hypothetical protein
LDSLRVNDVTPKSVAETAIVRAEPMDTPVFLTSAYEPTPAGAFTHLTTHIETTIPATLVQPFTSATAMTSNAVVVACAAMVDQMNTTLLVLNRMAYTLESNGLTS